MVTTKSAMTVSAVAFALLFGGGAYIMMNLGQFAKPITQRIASDAIGVDVSIGAMEIDLKAKKVVVKNIRVDNLPGYKTAYAMTISDVVLGLNSASKSLVDFKAIEVSGVEANLEVTPSGTNLLTLKNMIAARKLDSGKPVENAIKVIIESLNLRDMRVNPSVTLLSGTQLKSVSVPPLNLRNIGKKQNGVLAQDAVAQVMSPLLKSMSEAAGDAGFYEGLSEDALKDLGQSQIDQVTDKIKSLFE